MGNVQEYTHPGSLAYTQTIPCPHCSKMTREFVENCQLEGKPCVLHFYCPHCNNEGIVPAPKELQPPMRPGGYWNPVRGGKRGDVRF